MANSHAKFSNLLDAIDHAHETWKLCERAFQIATTDTSTEHPQNAGETGENPHKHRKLADDLLVLLKEADGQSITLGRMIEVLGDRGHAVLIIILTAPFLVLPIPGISTAFGAAIFMLGACVMLGIRPWLPKFISKREISNQKLQRLVGGVERVLKKVEKLVKPRMAMLTSKAWHGLIGLSLCAAAVALALPIPIPGNNVPPAIVLMFLAFGLLERDGITLIIGHVLNVLLWIILYLMGDFLIAMVQTVWDKVF